MTAVPATRYLLFFGIAVIGCAIDLATKSWVFGWLGPPDPRGRVHWLIEGLFGFQTSLNRGALFGIGQGQVWLFALFSCLAAVGILVWFLVGGAAKSRLLSVALAMIMAGVLGNLYDRLGLWSHPQIAGPERHAVRDWILFQFRGWPWPNFNIADSLLVCGAAALIWQSMADRGDSGGSASPTR